MNTALPALLSTSMSARNQLQQKPLCVCAPHYKQAFAGHIDYACSSCCMKQSCVFVVHEQAHAQWIGLDVTCCHWALHVTCFLAALTAGDTASAT